MEQVLSLSINTPLIKAMAKIPIFGKDVMRNCKDLEKASTIFLNEKCSTTVLEGLPKKMGDPGHLTLPCEG